VQNTGKMVVISVLVQGKFTDRL